MVVSCVCCKQNLLKCSFFHKEDVLSPKSTAAVLLTNKPMSCNAKLIKLLTLTVT